MTLATAPNAAIPAGWRSKARRAMRRVQQEVTEDMTPEAWRHLIAGLLEFLEEEKDEPEHAEDGMVQDESIKVPDIDGRLHVSGANICMESVSPYKGSEIPGWEMLDLKGDEIYQVYRPGTELSKPETVASANGIPLMRKHVATSAEDHKPWDTVGTVGTRAEWQAPYIVNDLAVWASEDIEGIESKKKTQLSPGYRYSPVREDGTFEGQKYQIRMTNIIFNHVAIVTTGRQGPDIAIDSAVELQWAAIEVAIIEMARRGTSA